MVLQIGVIDYHAGNIHSVVKALRHIGALAKIVCSPGDIQGVSGLIIPGVGAFGAGMKELVRSGLADSIQEFAGTGRPILGICLGMQLLFSESEELGKNKGLGLIPGRVVEVPKQFLDGFRYKIPHIAWEPICMSERNGNKGILAGIDEGEEVYFVHSFMAIPDSREQLVAYVNYGACQIAAIVRKGSIYGCQFHPEKSRNTGSKILRNFLEIVAVAARDPHF